MMKKTTVVNIKKGEWYDVYIGRPGKWGNPFILNKYARNRTQTVERFRKWITEGDGQHLLADLDELRGKRLGCYCAPRKCHGDVLAELADRR